MFADWEQNLDRFTDAVADFPEDLERWLKEMVDDLEIVDKPPNRLAEGFANVAQLDRSRRAQNTQQVFEAMGLNRKELAGDFHELRLEGLVPRYGYWPVTNPEPVRHFEYSSFAELLSGLWQNSGNAQTPGSNQRPVVCRQTLSVQANL